MDKSETPNAKLLVDATILAAAENSPFEQVEVLTIRAYLEQQAMDIALMQLVYDPISLNARANSILHTLSTPEFIEVRDGHIYIVIDVDEVTEDIALKASERLFYLESLSKNTKTEFGKNIKVYPKH